MNNYTNIKGSPPRIAAVADHAGYAAQVVYPEIFYQVQPFVMMACDQAVLRGSPLNQAMVDQITDTIYADVCELHPELAEYAQIYDMKTNEQYVTVQFGPGRRHYNNRFRRRGLLRDLIDILFLRELFGRYGLWF